MSWQQTGKSCSFQTTFALELGFPREDVFDSINNVGIKTQIQQNFLKVKIYFQTLDVLETVQTEKYTVSFKAAWKKVRKK